MSATKTVAQGGSCIVSGASNEQHIKFMISPFSFISLKHAPFRTKMWRANQVKQCDDTIEHKRVDANGGVGAKREKKLTCYTPEKLAPALVHVARENIKMPAKIIKPILRTLVSNELSSSFCNHSDEGNSDLSRERKSRDTPSSVPSLYCRIKR